MYPDQFKKHNPLAMLDSMIEWHDMYLLSTEIDANYGCKAGFNSWIEIKQNGVVAHRVTQRALSKMKEI